MGRRKIEIKAIKDDRNRSVTFLKRKGGLFKKAHELSVLCSVDVAVFVFGNNKKLYEYSSADMRELIGRYQYHGGPNEHKGPGDFNGGNDDDDDEDGDGTPPQPDGMDAHMMPPHYHGQPHPFPQIRHHTPSASPPMPHNGAFPGHPHHHPARGHTPQPSVGSRPGSRNDVRRMTTGMAPPQGPHPSMGYMPTPPVYASHSQPGMMPPQQPAQYPYAPPPPPSQQQHQPPQQQHQPPQQPQPPHQQPQVPQPQVYMEERRSSAPPGYMPQPPPPPQPMPIHNRPEPSPPQPNHAQPPPNVPQISTTPPQPERRDPLPPPPLSEIKAEPSERHPPLLNTESAIKKLPQRKTHSIFTPIEENRSILSQHLASFAPESLAAKSESAAAAALANASRSQSVEVGSNTRTSPPQNPSALSRTRTTSVSSIPETTFTPPSRSNSFKTGPGSASGARPRGPRLTVQIPDGGSEPGSATGESNSPRNNPPESTSQTSQQQSSHSSGVVLPPPSPSASASALLSAGATGPPNPFARPLPQQSVTADTPASALPSRFLGNEFLPSPSSFYNDWGFRNGDNTLPSPLNFATPVAGSGPSFLREETNFNSSTTSTGAATNGTLTATAATEKRKSIGDEENGPSDHLTGDAKRVKVV